MKKQQNLTIKGQMWVFSVVNLCFFVTKHIKHLNRISHSIESLDRKLINNQSCKS